MTDFSPFAKLIHKRFKQMSESELFVTVEGDALWAHYLASFPEGENPIYKEKTEHDCNCCRNFIRNLGNVVTITKGVVKSVWAVEKAEYPYDVVAAAMDKFVTSHAVTDLFRSSEPKYGAESTNQLLAGGAVKRWNHLYSEVYPKHRSQNVAQVIEDYRTTQQVFKRGLDELSFGALQTVLDLIAAKDLYRGAEFKPAIMAFQEVQGKYLKLKTESERANFVWENATCPAARFRNTAIGTLIRDLSECKDLAGAVGAFEFKMDGYKRPTALVTPAMVQGAMKTITELGLERDLERRYAKISDVTINNVLWVDNTVQSKMKGGIEDLLMSAITKKVSQEVESKAEDISIDDFMAKILPNATSMELLVKNDHQSNFMSLTAPVHESTCVGTGKLFKWNNDFAWSYDGNVTDSLRQRVAAAGGRVDGVLRFSHSWNYEPEMRNASLMDLHVFMPGSSKHGDGKFNIYPDGQRVGWNCRKDLASGGSQDVDYTGAAAVGYVPVENITFPSLAKLKEGKYVFKIHNWSLRQPTAGGFKAEIEFGGQVFEYEHRKPLGDKEWVTVAEATLKDGKFTIEHKLPHSASSRDKWGIKTETFVKVTTLMYSPNYWDDNQVGNKHWFFTVEGCKNEGTTRGIYNEYLNPILDKHRKVFELLGSKTQCPYAEDQLSGLGFSSTRGDKITVKVKGPKLYKTLNVSF